MGIETAKIVYLTDTANDNAKILPKSIGSAIIHKPSNDYETTDQTTVSAELDKHTTSIETEAKNVDDIQTEIGTETLSTTSQNLVGAINEINGGLSALFSEFVVGDSSGRVKLSNGLVIQWGKTSWLNDTAYTTITFPISFSSTPTIFITSWKQSKQALATGSVYNVSASGFSLYHCGTNSSAGSYYSWLAIGQAG